MAGALNCREGDVGVLRRGTLVDFDLSAGAVGLLFFIQRDLVKNTHIMVQRCSPWGCEAEVRVVVNRGGAPGGLRS